MKKILIIEDDQSIADLQKDYLLIEGYEVSVFTNGRLGWENAMEEAYDLIILDVMLPEMNGFDICHRIRAEQDIPVLMVSARKEDVDKIRGLGLGADDYITKPFSPGELVARVKAHLSRYNRLAGHQEKAQTQISLRGLVLDNQSFKVSYNNKDISLTAREFHILKLLAGTPDRVYSKEEIYRAVWGDSQYGDVTTVTVHIRKLREKLEEDPSEPRLIETVWGIGYCIRM